MKKILVVFLVLACVLVGCGGEEPSNMEESTEELNHPLYTEFEYEMVDPVDESGYGTFRVTNNSNYDVTGFKILFRKDEIEPLLASTESLKPGDTSPEVNVYVDTGPVNIGECEPIWMEIHYLDEDKNEQILRYDYILDVYEYY